METPSEDASCLEVDLVGQALQYVSTGTYSDFGVPDTNPYRVNAGDFGSAGPNRWFRALNT